MMAEPTIGVFSQMTRALQSVVEKHDALHGDVNAHGDKQTQRLAELHEKMQATEQMNNLTGRVKY